MKHIVGRLVAATILTAMLMWATTWYTNFQTVRVGGAFSPTTLSQQGMYLSWNHTVGGGEGDFVSEYGGGTGGFSWYNVAPNAGWGSPIMSVDYAGNLSANSFIGHVKNVSYGHSAGCGTGTSSYGTCTSTVTWNQAFSDTDYAASCMIISQYGFPAISGATKANGSVTVTIHNGTANGAVNSGGSLDCIATEN